MEFDSLTQMWVSGKQVEVAPSAQRLLSNRLRVPYSYLSRCPAELQARNLNYWIEQERQQRETFFCRFDANRLRAVFTERYTAIDNMEVLTKMIQHGFDPAGEIQFALDDEMMLLKMPEYDRAFQSWLGNWIKSFPAFPSPTVRSGYWPCPSRLSITGWSVPTDLSPRLAVDARYKHISRKVMDEFPEILRGVISQSHRGQ